MSIKQNHYIRQSLRDAQDKGAAARTLINQMPSQYDMIVDTYILQAERAQGNHSAARRANPYLTSYTANNGNRKTQADIARKIYDNMR